MSLTGMKKHVAERRDSGATTTKNPTTAERTSARELMDVRVGDGETLLAVHDALDGAVASGATGGMPAFLASFGTSSEQV